MRTFHIIKLSLAAAVILLCMPAKSTAIGRWKSEPSQQGSEKNRQ